MDQAIVSLFEKTNGHLAATLRGFRGRTVFYCPNPGNAGDSLIAAATYQLFQQYGISIDLISRPEDVKKLTNQNVFLSGGGNLVPLYQGMAGTLRMLLGKNNRIFVLPHSVRGNETLLASLEPSTCLFCREVESYRHALEHAQSCDVQMGHDLALYLDVEELMGDVLLKNDVEAEFRARLAERRLSPEKVRGQTMSCFRHGVEKTFIPTGPNYDISVMFQVGVDPKLARHGSWMMLEFSRLAAQITTNRLHVGVASALVGTPTILHDNSYGKVSGIYKHSMRNRFAHVRFVTHALAAEARTASEPAC